MAAIVKQRGILLVIVLLLLMLMSSISLVMLRNTLINNKAIANYNAQLEAQTKADQIASYAIRQLKKLNYQVTILKTCAIGTSCPNAGSGDAITVWNSVPTSYINSASNIMQKKWWRGTTLTYPGLNFPNAAALQGMTQVAYNATDGSAANDPVASYFVATVNSAPVVVDGYNVYTLLVVSYATDSHGKAGAIRQVYYTFAANCPVSGGAPVINPLTTTPTVDPTKCTPPPVGSSAKDTCCVYAGTCACAGMDYEVLFESDGTTLAYSNLSNLSYPVILFAVDSTTYGYAYKDYFYRNWAYYCLNGATYLKAPDGSNYTGTKLYKRSPYPPNSYYCKDPTKVADTTSQPTIYMVSSIFHPAGEFYYNGRPTGAYYQNKYALYCCSSSSLVSTTAPCRITPVLN